MGIGSFLLGTIACSSAPADPEWRRSAVVNGDDDRLEAFQVPAEARDPLVAASAALIHAHRLAERTPDLVALRAPTAAAALGLCPDEPFASEPAAAFCSGVLVDDDLVATARHCLGADAELAARHCRDLRIAFGYSLAAADRPPELRGEEVFACRRIVALDGDVAVVQLDRPARGRLSPRPLAAQPAHVGDELIVASYGAGLPLKIELSAVVTEVSQPSGDLTIDMDTFGGSSGGGVYDARLELVGLVAGGQVDWEAAGGCTRAAHSVVPGERAMEATQRRLAAAVCGAGWPSLRLCGTLPACGDGVCDAAEPPGCPSDCPAPRCGDSLCEPPERGACPEDCSPFEDVPESWVGDPADYRARIGPAPPGPTEGGCSISPRGGAPVPLGCLLALIAAFSGSCCRAPARRRPRRASAAPGS